MCYGRCVQQININDRVALAARFSDILAFVRCSSVGDRYIGEAQGHRAGGASVGEALRRLADAIDAEAKPAAAVDPLADRLAKVEQRLDAIVAAMREVARKDSVHPSVRFLADTIALNLGVATHG